jgi:hypothetical protein
MSKAADNERIKLRATWCNNVSVGLTLAGVALPMFSLFRGETLQFLNDWIDGRFHLSQLTEQDAMRVLTAAGVFCLAFVLAGLFRHDADGEMAKLQD